MAIRGDLADEDEGAPSQTAKVVYVLHPNCALEEY